jgi:hypothetical protein
MSAELIERTYAVSGTPFVLVQCWDCLAVLNSGHHYTGPAGRVHAQRLADEHNAEHHA